MWSSSQLRRATRRLNTGGCVSTSSSLRHSCSSDPRPPRRPPLPVQYLLAHDDSNFDPATHQRNDVSFDPIDGTPPLPRPTRCDESSSPPQFVSWKLCGSNNDDDAEEDGRWCLTTKEERCNNKNNNGGATITTHRKSYFTAEWITAQTERWRANVDDYDSFNDNNNQTTMTDDENDHKYDTNNHNVKRILWSNWTEKTVRDTKTSPILFHYDNLELHNNKQHQQQNHTPHNNEQHAKDEQRRLLQVLYQYGIVLITGTPFYTETLPIIKNDDDDVKSSSRNNLDERRRMNNDATIHEQEEEKITAESAILHLATIIGYYPQQTLYGAGVWSTSSLSSFENDSSTRSSCSSSSTADSAYGNTALPLHTDMTYMATPPGVQIFLMVQPATSATTGCSTTINNNPLPSTGQSIFLDGIAAARQLRLEHPNYYQLLTTTQRRYRCIDDSSNVNKMWHLEASGPIIETIPRSSSCSGDALVKSIRHNDLDRLPDLPPYSSTTAATTTTTATTATTDEFYHQLKVAHEAWDDILRRDSMRLVLNLQPGDCILVANHRCLHGRYAFETSTTLSPRVVMGCYVGMDELNSKWRHAGFRVL